MKGNAYLVVQVNIIAFQGEPLVMLSGLVELRYVEIRVGKPAKRGEVVRVFLHAALKLRHEQRRVGLARGRCSGLLPRGRAFGPVAHEVAGDAHDDRGQY